MDLRVRVHFVEMARTSALCSGPSPTDVPAWPRNRAKRARARESPRPPCPPAGRCPAPAAREGHAGHTGSPALVILLYYHSPPWGSQERVLFYLKRCIRTPRAKRGAGAPGLGAPGSDSGSKSSRQRRLWNDRRALHHETGPAGVWATAGGGCATRPPNHSRGGWATRPRLSLRPTRSITTRASRKPDSASHGSSSDGS